VLSKITATCCAWRAWQTPPINIGNSFDLKYLEKLHIHCERHTTGIPNHLIFGTIKAFLVARLGCGRPDIILANIGVSDCGPMTFRLHNDFTTEDVALVAGPEGITVQEGDAQDQHWKIIPIHSELLIRGPGVGITEES
jgi:hypothetical protein